MAKATSIHTEKEKKKKNSAFAKKCMECEVFILGSRYNYSVTEIQKWELF